jgi:hypothetical protein
MMNESLGILLLDSMPAIKNQDVLQEDYNNDNACCYPRLAEG